MFWLLLFLFDIPQGILSCIMCILVAYTMKPKYIKHVVWGTAVGGIVCLHNLWYTPLTAVVVIPLHILALLMVA